MKNNIDKHLEKLTNKIMEETSLESPSFDFTDNIISQVQIIKTSDVTVYKPLISKSIWILIALGFITLIGYLILGTTSQDSEALFTINFDVLFNNRFTETLSAMKFSDTLMYAIVSLGIMLFIQIPLLKNYFDNRLAI